LIAASSHAHHAGRRCRDRVQIESLARRFLFEALIQLLSLIVNLNVDARFDRLRNDARFVELIRRMRFPNPGFPR